MGQELKPESVLTLEQTSAERKNRTSEEKIVVRPKLDQKYYVKSFFSWYKCLVDRARLKNDKEGYSARIARIQKELADIDWNKQTLFICNKSIAKDIFLVGASRLPSLRSVMCCTANALTDIYWGLCRNDNPRLDVSDMYYSERDLKQGLLCVTIDKDFRHRASVNVLSQVIMSRYESDSSRLNWIFFYGTESDFEAENNDDLRVVFKEKFKEDGTFQVINLCGRFQWMNGAEGSASSGAGTVRPTSGTDPVLDY